MEIKDVEALAKLARINLSEEEKETFAKDIGSILSYVDKIKEVATEDAQAEVGAVYNAFREDVEVEKDEKMVTEIKNQFPGKEGDYLKVKKILG